MNSSSMIEGWTPLISSQLTTFSWVRETTASKVLRLVRSRTTMNACRSTWVPLPGFQASTSFLDGSFSITYTKRWPAWRPRSFLRIVDAAWTSSDVSGSSGCLVVATDGSTVCMCTSGSPCFPGRGGGRYADQPLGAQRSLKRSPPPAVCQTLLDECSEGVLQQYDFDSIPRRRSASSGSRSDWFRR